ncbi:hypothetical protein VE01_05168 [Pseudogymnoascus verrucosus]|uniref:AB hydrolase-1 domain-containing protein n=1 Tax=Pseudogymnoascus verrucosus TaxID=342668 RepID=A0A1B8GI87_9PEZI|nr:uncharacterized protein VE01_05168 [Pseudogymnoascus verrucosus]OBT95539.1 hypothetical protein VE01_05168 [Pseudogymnoascus verrucosus]
MCASPADPIYLPPLSPSTAAEAKHHLLVFLPGNPGYPGYYAPFLSALRTGLPASPSGEDAVHIRCLTLPGFAPAPTDPQPQPNSPPSPQTSFLSLSETTSALLTTILGLRIPSGPRAGEPHDSLTLLGHSVGAYLALSVLSVLSQLPATTRATTRAILLFPTITDIAQSPSGAVLAPLLRYVPFVPELTGLLARGGLYPLPRPWLESVVGAITGQGSEAAKVTSEFLRSKEGVRRALQLAGEEMVGIAEDVWGEEVWGTDVEEEEGKPARLMLYFGRNDHFVDEEKRDALMAKRGGKGGVRFEIDEAGIPHAFCLNHSKEIAEKVAPWVGEMVLGVKAG